MYPVEHLNCRIWITVLVVASIATGSLVGCVGSDKTIPTHSPVFTSTPIPIAESVYQVSPTFTNERLSTIQVTPTPTNEPTITPPPPTQDAVIVPWEVDKDLLIWVEIEENTQFAQGSLAIFSPSDAMPRLILSDQRYSFEHPRWSRDGDWIAFRQRDVAKQPRYQMGIVRQDGTDLHVFPGEYGNMSNIGWSPNSDWLFFGSCVGWRFPFCNKHFDRRGRQSYASL